MSEQTDLTEAEIALMDAIKTIIETLAAKGVAKPEDIARLFQYQRDKALSQKQPTAAAVHELLAQFCRDRGALRGLVDSEPEGSA